MIARGGVAFSMDDKDQRAALSRRHILGLLTAGGVAAPRVLPGKWVKPVVDLIIVPAHAQASPINCVNQAFADVELPGDAHLMLAETAPPTTKGRLTTTTTTTTTTQNPDGSTTQHEETQATTSCAVGSHESRTFGTVLQAHQTIWSTSGLLGTLNLLKSLTWPSTLPVIALPSAFFGSQQVDFNQWTWFFTVLRTLVIATASIAAYRIIFVGGGQTT